MIGNALKSLSIDEYVIYGPISNEQEFLSNFKKVVGKDETNTAILSSDPSLFGVTWKQLSDQIKIEEQKYKDTQYQRDRQYPDLGEQFDLLFKDIDSGKVNKNGGFYKAIKSVKDKHPKPSE